MRELPSEDDDPFIRSLREAGIRPPPPLKVGGTAATPPRRILPIALVLLATGWAVSLFVIGIVLRFGQSAEIMAWAIVFLMMSVSGVFYPVEALPGGLQPLAAVLPTTYAFEAMRAILDGEPMPWDQLGIAAAMTVALGLAGVAFAAHMLRVFRRGGYVTRFS